MAWNNYKQKKRKIPLSAAEKAYIQMKLEEYKTKFFKPIRGEVVYKRKGHSQEIVATARYKTEEDLKEDAKRIVDSMNEHDTQKDWILVSARVLGVEKIEDDNKKKDEDKNNED